MPILPTDNRVAVYIYFYMFHTGIFGFGGKGGRGKSVEVGIFPLSVLGPSGGRVREGECDTSCPRIAGCGS